MMPSGGHRVVRLKDICMRELSWLTPLYRIAGFYRCNEKISYALRRPVPTLKKKSSWLVGDKKLSFNFWFTYWSQ